MHQSLLQNTTHFLATDTGCLCSTTDFASAQSKACDAVRLKLHWYLDSPHHQEYPVLCMHSKGPGSHP